MACVKLRPRIQVNVLKDMEEHLRNHIFITKSRGLHADDLQGPEGETEADFMDESRRFAAVGLALIMRWIEKEKEFWPQWLTDLIEELTALGADISHKTTGKLMPKKIIFEWWKSEYGSRRRGQGLTGPKNYRSFERIYILRGPSYIADFPEVVENIINSLFNKSKSDKTECVKDSGSEITVREVMKFLP